MNKFYYFVCLPLLIIIILKQLIFILLYRVPAKSDYIIGTLIVFKTNNIYTARRSGYKEHEYTTFREKMFYFNYNIKTLYFQSFFAMHISSFDLGRKNNINK